MSMSLQYSVQREMMWWILTLAVTFSGFQLSQCQFFECHDDPSYEPDEGPLSEMQFTWLGALQYIHVKNGTPHFFRVPRVVLISRQFVLSTAVDAAQIPDGYALGNVAFGEYERDESECGVTTEDLVGGATCEPASLLVPLSDVLLHPEYKHFGATDSIALLKLLTPIRSSYMLPACLPFQNYLVTKIGRQIREKIYHVDFVSEVPRDFLEEEKEVMRIALLPRELCFLYGGGPANTSSSAQNRIMCTTGCGFHSGAPSLMHEHTGHWSIVALSQGGSSCPDPLRSRRPPPPPRHILLHPYVPWITAAITGKAVGAFAKDDPFGFMMPRASIFDRGHDWSGHWWMGGPRCYDRGAAADDMYRFYHEIFQVKPTGLTYLNYFLEISCPHSSNVICIKVGMPYKIGRPRVWNLDSPSANVAIPVVKFSHLYKFQVEAWGYNATDSTGSSSDSSSYYSS